MKRANKRGRPRSSRRRPTPERILDAALDLFSRHGVKGASMRDIARVAGITDAAIYAHFEGKAALHAALVDRAGPGLLTSSAVAWDRIARVPPDRALPRAVKGLLSEWDTPKVRRFTSLVLRQGAVGLSAVLQDVARRMTPAFASWCAAGQLRDDLAPDHLAWEFIAPLSSIRLVYLHAQSTPSQRRAGWALGLAHARAFVRLSAPPR